MTYYNFIKYYDFRNKVIIIKNILKSIFSLNDSKVNETKDHDTINIVPQNISNIIEQNEKYLRETFSNCFDLNIRKISLFDLKFGRCLLVYLNEMVDEEHLENDFISKLTTNSNIVMEQDNIEETIKYYLGVKETDIFSDLDKCKNSILNGKVVLFIDTLNKAFSINIKNELGRSITEPKVETVLRGPRDGFTESLSQNMAMIRTRIRNAKLKTELFTIGRETKTDLAIMYLSGTCDEKILTQLRERINKINLEAVVDSNYIIENIEDDTLCLFPLVFRTERPDVATMKLFEGKVVIILNNSPVALSVPSLFIEYMQSPEDYYMKYFFATLNRWIRYLSFFIATLLPGLYVGIISFHQELIPTSLAITIITARSHIPLPAFFECLVLLIAYETLREAGARMPRQLGQTLSIVGTLIIGEAAISAGMVSALMIVVVAFSGTALFAISSQEMYTAIAILRFVFLLLGGLAGMVGIVYGILILEIYLVSRRSFGVPYMYPLCPFNLSKTRDALLRVPLWNLDKKNRPLR